MKNATLSILFATLVTATVSAQQIGLQNRAFTASPYQAFTKRDEFQLGFEKIETRRSAYEVNLGFRFRGSEDPGLSPYFTQDFVRSSVGTVQEGLGFFLFIPLPMFGNDEDWTEKTEHREYYTNSHVFGTVGYKYYVLPMNNKHVQGGLYMATGLTLGRRGVSEYVFAEGQKGYMTVLDENWTSSDPNPWGILLGTGFIGTTKVVQEDVYNFSRLEIEKYHQTYLKPHFKLGFQLPIGQHASLDLGGQLSVNGPREQHFAKQTFTFEGAAKLGWWF